MNKKIYTERNPLFRCEILPHKLVSTSHCNYSNWTYTRVYFDWDSELFSSEYSLNCVNSPRLQSPFRMSSFLNATFSTEIFWEDFFYNYRRVIFLAYMSSFYRRVETRAAKQLINKWLHSSSFYFQRSMWREPQFHNRLKSKGDEKHFH